MRKAGLYLFFLLLLCAGCAVIQAPGGGDPDRKPPYAKKYVPDSAALNFSAKKITITFSEYITVTDLRNQLIVSPPMDQAPEIQARGKDLIIKLDDTLRPNTTYTINFGNAIRDITEGNAADNFRYVFSTGPVIDSLHASGKVVNAFSNTGEKNVMVMLYDVAEDSAPFKRRPVYFTKTKDDGSFRLGNLHEGRYKVFALTDADNDYLYDGGEERIAFMDSLLVLNGNVDSLKLRLFREDKGKPGLKKTSYQLPGKILLEFGQPLKEPAVDALRPLPDSTSARLEVGVKKDTLIYWLHRYAGDSLYLRISDGGKAIDTAGIRIVKPEKRKGKGSEDTRKLSLSANVVRDGKLNLRQPLVLKTNTPLASWRFEKIELRKGKDKVAAKIELDKSTNRSFSIDAQLEEDSSYALFIPPNALTDFFGQKNDSLLLPFSVRRYTDYGSVNLSLKKFPEGKHYILQLLDEKAAVLKESAVEKETKLSFDLLLPGSYGLRLIEDANANGKWDSGDYLSKRQPEKVMYYSGALKVRAGWDMDVEWNLK